MGAGVGHVCEAIGRSGAAVYPRGGLLSCPRVEAAKDTAPVRAGEELDAARLAAYLADKLPGAGRGVEIEQFPGGHSNLTYLVRAGGREYVLRRPPMGPLPPRAHDMAREFGVLERVSAVYPPAPRAFAMCENPAVAGAPFFVMERRRGVVLRREAPPEFATLPGYPARTAEAFVDALAELHSIDIARGGLGGIGKPEGFLRRQVEGWSRRWEAAKTSELPEMKRLAEWLANELPASPAPTIVHNDYKLDNVMFAAGDPGRLVAVLDWEMATVGDPLVDLGIVLCYWPEAGDPEGRRVAISPLTASPGWPARAELLARYHEKTGRDLAGVAYYEVFGVFKLAVVLQQIYYRYRAGQTLDERFRDFDVRVRGLAEAGVAVLERQ